LTDRAFETHAEAYDAWYDQFPKTFQSEVLAIQRVVPRRGDWVEVGVGTGRFAQALGIPVGVEPSKAMASIAKARGIEVIPGVAEALPLTNESCDGIFFITSLCFVRDPCAAIREAARVLRPGGSCVIGMLPVSSALGHVIEARRGEDIFFQHASLREPADVRRLLKVSGLVAGAPVQTLVGDPALFERCVQDPISGWKRGSFVVLSGRKRPDKAGGMRRPASSHGGSTNCA
jgi:SAM-dependent methyltransferase